MERPRAHMLLIAVVTAALPLLSRAQEQRLPEQPPEEQQVFKAGAELVVLHVNVFDGRSDAVPNLPQSAFSVYEDGRPQDIAFFEAAMSVLSGVPIINARLLIHDQGVLGLQSIYQYAHLPLDLFPAFRAAFDVARDMDYDGGDRDRQRFAVKVIERVLTRLEKLDERNLDYLMARLQQLAA